MNSKKIGGGWIASLEAELAKYTNIQLGIVFKSKKEDAKSFKLDKTEYFPVSGTDHRSNSKLSGIIKRWRHELDSETIVQRYVEIIDQFKPEIIHIFGTEFDHSLIVSKTTIPCVIHIQGNLIVYMQKWYSGLTAYEIFKYSRKKFLLKGRGHFHEYFLFKKAAERERKVFQDCSFFMGRTDWDRRITSVFAPKAAYFHCDEIMRNVFYTHNWQPQPLQNDLILVSTIRDCTYKGLETIFECKRILKQVHNKKNITWKIVGINENDEICYLIERKYKDTFRNNNIQLMGRLEDNELLNVMLASSLFIHPSHIENSPNSVCEAMLIGMPIIATYTGGTSSLIDNNIDGLLVQDGDSYALAGAILELAWNKTFAEHLGANAKKRAIPRHDPVKISENVINIYNKILTKQP